MGKQLSTTGSTYLLTQLSPKSHASSSSQATSVPAQMVHGIMMIRPERTVSLLPILEAPGASRKRQGQNKYTNTGFSFLFLRAVLI